jgi:diazepam-binding inhibitor (GABA receptor modulating acyl-CoA-binding protein)
MSNSKEFLTAADYVKKLKSTPNNDELGVLYGLYKQATVGDINVPKPGFFSFKESKKWESWNQYKGLSTYDSEVKYITTVNDMIQKYGV